MANEMLKNFFYFNRFPQKLIVDPGGSYTFMLLTIERRKKCDMLTVLVVKVKYCSKGTVDAKDKPPHD